MTTETVIKGLECCFSNGSCDGCPYTERVDCRRELERNALALIKELQTDYSQLTNDYEDLSFQVDKLEDICETQKHYIDYLESSNNAMQVKLVAVTENFDTTRSAYEKQPN